MIKNVAPLLSVCATNNGSLQNGMYVLGKAHKCSIPTQKLSPQIAVETVPLFIWLTMALPCPFKKDHWALPFSLASSLPGNWWCNVHGFVPTDSVSSSSTLHIFWDIIHLWWLLFPPDYMLHHFHQFWHVQDSTSRGAFQGGHWTQHMPVWASQSITNNATSQSLKRGSGATVGGTTDRGGLEGARTDAKCSWFGWFPRMTSDTVLMVCKSKTQSDMCGPWNGSNWILNLQEQNCHSCWELTTLQVNIATALQLCTVQLKLCYISMPHSQWTWPST